MTLRVRRRRGDQGGDERRASAWSSPGPPPAAAWTWTCTARSSGRRGGESISYWKDEFQTSGHGAFEAPVAGNHGWFWQNLNDDPVTVTVQTAGFYRRLFRP